MSLGNCCRNKKAKKMLERYLAGHSSHMSLRSSNSFLPPSGSTTCRSSTLWKLVS